MPASVSNLPLVGRVHLKGGELFRSFGSTKIRRIEGSCGGNTLLWVVDKNLINEVERGTFKGRKSFAELSSLGFVMIVIWIPAIEGSITIRRGKRLPQRQIHHVWPGLHCWRAAQVKDEGQLFDLGVARENGLRLEQLGHDAADRPGVDGRAVAIGLTRCAQQELWWPVPERDDAIRVVLQCGGVAGLGTCQAPVANLQVAVA
mmetsp:Transcript_19928/g.60249  ORF Transcript_19928/g.60249 Transcript_19928/m.60249 type:complete len:203 (+) Transcript_19928:713-1321(+)